MGKAGQGNCKFPEQRRKLLRMYKEDQHIRIHGDFNSPQTVLDMSKIDLAHQVQLVKTLEVIKLPSVANICYDGAETVWLIAQHAGYNLTLMKQVLELMTATTKDDPDAGYYRGIPYLTDRVKIMEGKPQVYGTQFWANPSGTPEPYPIKDVTDLDDRRKIFGLRSFQDYKKDITEANKLPKRPILYILY